MSRFRVIVLAGLLFVEAGYILVGGIVSGRWMWGLVFGVAAGLAAIDWLWMRARLGDEAQAVADRMIFGTMAVLLGLVIQVSGWLEAP